MLGVVVISPHLDDAVLSIGATLHRLAGDGHPIRVVTVFAGDPTRTGPPSYWDAERGVASAAEALELRRQEDQEAARVIGFEPVWLPFEDNGYVYRRDPDEIMCQLRPHLEDASLVLVPGWPLKHADHRYAAMLMIQQIRDLPVVLYAELPYAASPRTLAVSAIKGRGHSPAADAVPDEVDWRSVRIGREDGRAKQRAIACYHGELAALGYRAHVLALYGRVGRSESFGYSDHLLDRGAGPRIDAPGLLVGSGAGLPNGRLTNEGTT